MAKNLIKKKELSILIIDDHKMLRDGLKLMLSSLAKTIPFHITEAESGEAGIEKMNRFDFELVIMDYQLPGLSGAETIHRILRFKPNTKILALSNYDELPYIQSMIEAGAKGYVLKNIEPGEMLTAIKSVLADKNYYCSEVAIKLIDAGKDKSVKESALQELLSKREIEVLQWIAMELTNEEIAQKLFVAKRTVDTHRQNLINKLNVRNTAGLVKFAYKMNLVHE